ncbi:MAG: autotransporter assembly complex protein TamA [Rhizobiaceae bacterium]|nr:autotransporter assembly complex protein TamA [Rhizobiaceae bacterium]
MSAAIALASVFAGAPAYGFELFGIKIFGKDEPDPAEEVIGEPQHYAVTFNVSGEDKKLKKKLEAASSLVKDDEKPASGAAGLLAKARGDYRRLLSTLYGEGLYGGTISITVEGREAANMAPDTQLPDPAAVVVNIDPGPLFHFGQANIVNPAPPAQHRRDEVADPAEEGYRAGEVARSGTIIRAETLTIEAWRQQGHAKAKAIDRRVVAAHDTNLVDATVGADPGPMTYYGDVSVSGTERMDPDYVAYMTGLPRGAEFDPDDIARANVRLSKLDVFRALRIEEGAELGPGGSLPISVIVQERLPRRFGVGANYSTIDGAGFEAYWMHRNLFGRAERLRFDAKVAGLGPTVDPSELTYKAGVTFTKPGVFTPDTDFIASLIGEREVLDVYTRNSVTAQVGFTHMFTNELQGKLFAVASRSRFEDDVFGTRDFMTLGMLGGLTYDSRDKPVDATRGTYLDGTIEPFYEAEYGNFASRFTGEARGYLGFGEKRPFVLAGRVKLGSVVGASIAELPPDVLFFAGGGGSVRGYGYRTIGVPVAGTDLVTGGRSLIEASVEARARVTDTIGVVGFIDAGYVGAETFPDFDEDLKLGVGGGLRYYTGLGPLRLDVAVPLDPGPDDPDVAFYVGIGQAF